MHKKGILPKLKNLLLGLALVTTSSVNAYEFIKGKYDENLGWIRDEEGKGVKWKLDENGRRELKYQIDRNCSKDVEELFIKSARKWSDALDGRITFVSCKNSKEREIFITADTLEPQRAATTYIVPSLEETLSEDYYLKSSKMILNKLKFFDISPNDRLNSEDTNSSRETKDLLALFREDIITHELGHILGLSDIYEVSKITAPYNMQNDFPTMFFENRGFGIQSTLHLDDIDGVRSRYELSEWQDRSLSDEIHIEQIERKKYRVYVSSNMLDDNVIWNLDKNNEKKWKTGFEAEVTLGKDISIRRKKGDRRNKYCFKVSLEWNGKTAEYEIPLRTLRKAKKEMFSVSPKTKE